MKTWMLYVLSILFIAGVFYGCKKTIEFDSAPTGAMPGIKPDSNFASYLEVPGKSQKSE